MIWRLQNMNLEERKGGLYYNILVHHCEIYIKEPHSIWSLPSRSGRTTFGAMIPVPRPYHLYSPHRTSPGFVL